MLDLAYVLLVVFIILTTAAVQGVKVQAPLTHAANNLSKPQTRAITVTADGAIFLDAYPVTLEQLAAYPHVDHSAVGFYLAPLEARGKWNLIDETHLRSSRF